MAPSPPAVALATPAPAPPGSPARDGAVDALRGFALLGIVLVNVPFFAAPIAVGPVIEGRADAWAFSALAALAIGKFFLIFSFLFGFGFATSIAADARAGRASGPRLARRLAGLLAFGLVHAVFLFVGDILMLYAALGALLWLARGLAPGRLVALALLAYGVAVLAQGVALIAAVPDAEAAFERARGAHLGSFWDAARFRLREEVWIGQPFILVFNGPAALAMFLLGLVLAAMARSAAAPLLAAGYGLLVLRAADRRPDHPLVRLLALAGGMTLTGYLGHSVILGFVFGGWGLGLYGQVGAAACLAIGLATYALLLALFAAWRQAFRYGPDEWLLRSWVDLAWKPMRA